MDGISMNNRITESIVEYLRSKDYPEQCIALEWGGRHLFVDIAVLAHDLITPLALFEIKTVKRPDSILRGINFLKKAVSTIDINVKCYLAFGKDSEPYFELYDVTSVVYSTSTIDTTSVRNMKIVEPLSYKTLQNGVDGRIKKSQHEKRQNRIDRIKPICWVILPLFIIVIVLLDAFKIYELTSLRLITFGGLIVIILIPFYNEVSLKEFTLKRKDDSNE